MTATIEALEGLFPMLANLALQSGVVLASAWLVARVTPRRAAAVRHFAWTSAVVIVLAMPLLYGTWPRRGGAEPIVPGREASAPGAVGEPDAASDAPTAPAPAPKLASAAGGEVPVPIPLPESGVVRGAIAPADVTEAPEPLSGRALLVAAWMLGSLVMLARYARGTWRARNLVARADPAPGELAACVAVLAERLRLRRTPVVRLSDEVASPALCGWLAPVIVLPKRLASDLPAPLLEPLLMHELAHLERLDPAISQAAWLMRVLHWYDPLAWVARRALERDRELLADARVLALAPARSDYAEGLLRVLRSREGGAVPAAVGLGDDAGGLEQRLGLIVRGVTLSSLRHRTRAALAAVALAAGTGAMSLELEGEARGAAPPEPARAAGGANQPQDGGPVLVVVDLTEPAPPARDLASPAIRRAWPPERLAAADRLMIAGVCYDFLALRDYLKRYVGDADPRYRDEKTGETTTRVVIRCPADQSFDLVFGVMDVVDSLGMRRVELMETGHPERHHRVWFPRKPDRQADLVTITPGANGRAPTLGHEGVPPALMRTETDVEEFVRKLPARSKPHPAAVLEASGVVPLGDVLTTIAALRARGYRTISFRSRKAFSLGEHPLAASFYEAWQSGFPPVTAEEPVPPVLSTPPLLEDEAAEQAIARSLAWLAATQRADGSWPDTGSQRYDDGVTGLATLAFLGAGYVPLTGAYGADLERAITYLLKRQDPEGCFGSRKLTNFTYTHAVVTLALAEAWARSRQKRLEAPLEKAAGFILTCQNPYKAWRYGVANGDNDTSATGWHVMALKAAEQAGVEIDPGSCSRSLAWAMDWIEEMTDDETARVGYNKRGEPPVRTPSTYREFPSGESEALTAIGLTVRSLCGQNHEHALVRMGLELLHRKPPVWNRARGSIDMCYWYYGTLAMQRHAAPQWPAWRQALRQAVIPNQRKDGSHAGSWDPAGAWGKSGGRVYATAILTLALETSLR